MNTTYSRISILIALIICLLLVGSVYAAEQENMTPEITPDVTLDLTPEVTPDVTLEITTEISPDLKVPELLAADDLPVLAAAGDPLKANFTQNRTYGPAPLPVQFYDRSTGTPANWSWDFGDGATSGLKNPLHTYSTAGNYTVTLLVSDGVSSDTYEVTDSIRADTPVAPVAALSANKTSWSSPAAVQFYDRSTGYPTTWSWDFGDGATSTVKNPVHTYIATGNYTVTLTVTNDLGSDTITQAEYFHANDPAAPTAALSANKTAWSAPAVIQFYDRSTGFPTSWAWEFGDGATSTVRNPVHIYAATGNYTVTLTATNDLGSDTKTAAGYIIVSGSSAPVAALSANKTSWSAPAAIQFYDKSTGFPTSWAWDFGDGTNSTVKHPVHTYQTTGNYTVTLTTTNDLGSDTKTVIEYIKVSNSVAPVAVLSANKTAWSVPAAIQFYDKSTGYPTSWSWDFGDGVTSMVKNPVHTFTGTGNYTVILTVANDVGNNTIVQTDYIKTSLPVTPTASLSANKTSGSAPAAIQFYDRSSGFPTSWSWDFGDGSNSTVKNPVHTYMMAGNYTVSLTASNDVGNNRTIRVDYIRISGSSAPLPVPYIWASPASGAAPLAVHFMGSSEGSPLRWNWSFGDGEFSGEQNLNHTYLNPGLYSVSLTVEYPNGVNTTSQADMITVMAPENPVFANFTSDVTEGNFPLNVQFTDFSTGFPVSWNWSFGDGMFSEVQNPAYYYSATGNYTVNLTVTDAGGNTSSISRPAYIHVLPGIPLPILGAYNVSGPAPLTVGFVDNSMGSPTSWNWSFGDGDVSNEQNPVHTYLNPGLYLVSLTAENYYGVNTTIQADFITVTAPEEPVVANFTADVTEGPAPLAVNFTDNSTGSPVSWNWSFGDGTFADVQNPVHIFTANGNYTVSLVVSNGYSSDTLTEADYIITQPSGPAYDSVVRLNSMPTTMYQGEYYLVDIKVNNTGTKTWYGDPSNTNFVFMQGLGDASGDAARFNITHIPMLFENETVAPGESYDFFFYVHAPDTLGTYTPQYQVSTASGGVFGPVVNVPVNVIKNPFNPVLQPDGSKLYTTRFGNTTSGVSVDIVGPDVYIDTIHGSSFTDPRYLINPTLKSGVFNLELNESFSYANVSISYDPAKTATPSNLAIGYFNQTTGNYTFVPSTVDTVNHTVTARVTSADNPIMKGASVGAIDAVQYHALPANTQNEMGYINVSEDDQWTIYPPVDSYVTTPFGNGASFPPGNYTILTTGSYTSYYVQYIGCVNWVGADSNPDNTYGYYVNFANPAGGYKQVQRLRVSSGTLKVDHKGGPISVYHSHIVNGVCGSVGYRMYYGDGPALRDNETDFRAELNNDKFNATELGYDIAVTAYQAAAGCVLGQAGVKGGIIEMNPELVPGYSQHSHGAVSESPAYLVGQLACNVAFPEATLTRDFLADIYRGDPLAVAIDAVGIGSLSKVHAVLGSSSFVPAFVNRFPNTVHGADVLVSGLSKEKILLSAEDQQILAFVRNSHGDAFVDDLLSRGYTEAQVVQLAKKGVKLGAMDNALTNSFFYVVKDKNGVITGVSRASEFMANTKATDELGGYLFRMSEAEDAGLAGSVNSWFIKVKGKYGEWVMKRTHAEGIPEDKLAYIIDPETKLVTGHGPDMIAVDSRVDSAKVLTMGESKNTVAKSMSLSDFEKYFTDARDTTGKPTSFNMDNILKYTPVDKRVIYNDATVTEKKLVIYINGPNSETIKTNLIKKLPDSLSLPYNTVYETIPYSGTINIEIIAQNV
jgi:PKD repeat protein